ncbi:hypothetical protein CLF_105743 [Clonorchis sinensis]|uniref:Uncharacterized protein n=1 Tax=Clonorchis sinensis TaxID=79923 RepID=G7YE44_CLOSI|nr:hypothetical protein CLF_105743 [Clonorchis sinensis]
MQSTKQAAKQYIAEDDMSKHIQNRQAYTSNNLNTGVLKTLQRSPHYFINDEVEQEWRRWTSLSDTLSAVPTGQEILFTEFSRLKPSVSLNFTEFQKLTDSTTQCSYERFVFSPFRQMDGPVFQPARNSGGNLCRCVLPKAYLALTEPHLTTLSRAAQTYFASEFFSPSKTEKLIEKAEWLKHVLWPKNCPGRFIEKHLRMSDKKVQITAAKKSFHKEIPHTGGCVLSQLNRTIQVALWQINAAAQLTVTPMPLEVCHCYRSELQRQDETPRFSGMIERYRRTQGLISAIVHWSELPVLQSIQALARYDCTSKTERFTVLRSHVAFSHKCDHVHTCVWRTRHHVRSDGLYYLSDVTGSCPTGMGSPAQMNQTNGDAWHILPLRVWDRLLLSTKRLIDVFISLLIRFLLVYCNKDIVDKFFIGHYMMSNFAIMSWNDPISFSRKRWCAPVRCIDWVIRQRGECPRFCKGSIELLSPKKSQPSGCSNFISRDYDIGTGERNGVLYRAAYQQTRTKWLRTIRHETFVEKNSAVQRYIHRLFTRLLDRCRIFTRQHNQLPTIEGDVKLIECFCISGLAACTGKLTVDEYPEDIPEKELPDPKRRFRQHHNPKAMYIWRVYANLHKAHQ